MEIHKRFFKTPVIYHLSFNSVIVYVGQTMDIEKRLHDHKLSEKKFDGVAAFHCKVQDLNNTEAASIVDLNPILNLNFPTNTLYTSKSKILKLISNQLDIELLKIKPAHTVRSRAKFKYPIYKIQEVCNVLDYKVWQFIKLGEEL